MIFCGILQSLHILPHVLNCFTIDSLFLFELLDSALCFLGFLVSWVLMWLDSTVI